MYVIFPVVLVFLLVCAILFYYRKKHIMRYLCTLTFVEKLCILNELIEPFGFRYCLSQDLFMTCTDAWQREYGYRYLYDVNAPLFNMVFDCEPIYFNYHEKTWLIEFWKGQYGINTGAEIGIYHTDAIIPEHARPYTRFHSAADSEMLPFSITLQRGSEILCALDQTHWWLAGFRMGLFSEPEELRMKISITFPDVEMLEAFIASMLKAGYSPEDLSLCHLTVSFVFNRPYSGQPQKYARFSTAFARIKNRLFLKCYYLVTSPYRCTVDKLLYLYEYLPFVFRRMVHVKKRASFRRRK